MPENWFFSDPAALARAGCSTAIQPIWTGAHVEQLEVTDPESQDRCAKQNEIAQRFWQGYREQLHAKHYLEELVARSEGAYKETRGGADALRDLDWAAVAPPGASPFVQALFEDLAQFFDVPSPLPSPAAPCPTLPAVTAQRHLLVLRNA